MIEEKIPVVILGQTYEILGNPSDALYYNSLARYVEDKMKEIQQLTHIVSTQKIAVLAALNITDELFQDRENKSNNNSSQEKKQEDLIKLLEETLKESAVE